MITTSKEALERLVRKLYNSNDDCVSLSAEDYMLIKTIDQDLDKLEKLEKTIEILKSILIVEGYIREDGSHRYYLCKRNVFPVYTITLTKDQYELLKEVLGND